MKFSCPECGQRIEVKESWAGREINCPNPNFEHRFTVKVPSSSQDPTPTSEPAKPASSSKSVEPAEPLKSASSPEPPKTAPPPVDTSVKSSSAPPPPPKWSTKAPASSRPPTPKGNGRSPGNSVVHNGLIFALLGFLAALTWLDLSPRQFWKRLTRTAAAVPVPAAIPTTPPTRVAPPAPSPTAVVVATPRPSAATPVEGAGPDATATPAPAGGPTSADLPALQRPPTQIPWPDRTPPHAPMPTVAGDDGVAPEPSHPKSAPVKAGEYFGSLDPGVADADLPPREFPSAGPLQSVDREETTDAIAGRRLVLRGTGALHLTGTGDPLPGSAVNFTSADAWLYVEKQRPSAVASTLLSRWWVNGVPARVGGNLRVVPYGSGTVVIPQGPDFAAMQVFSGADLNGEAMPLRAGVKYDDASLGAMKTSVASFRLKRGYTATIAQEENGTGVSRNYVAQDHDLEVRSLPVELDRKIRFVRIFPWRWTDKKGVAGGIWENLVVGWYYNWNISDNSRLDLEYVPIKQKRGWPGLNQDWIARGSTALLGYNEPDHKDQSNLTVDEAIAGWPELLGTGLRLGSPSVSDGGLNWLYDFMQKAEAGRLRVDFVAVHYYRAVSNPADARGAAAQFYNYLRGIHDRTHRPIWVTEWNNGANWTGHKPDYEQERAAIADMVKMLEETPFVERYAIYNWVEDTRNVQRKDGSLTPAGEVYRDKVSTIGYVQARP